MSEPLSDGSLSGLMVNGSRPVDAPGLDNHLRQMLDEYFCHLDGHGTHELYRLVLETVERPLLESVLDHTRGNQTRASEILGINRGTLRKKLKQYGLD